MWWLCGSRATVPPRTLWGALGALVLPVQTGIGSSSYFHGGNWEAFGSRQRGKMLRGQGSFLPLPAAVLLSPSLMLLLLFTAMPRHPSCFFLLPGS